MARHVGPAGTSLRVVLFFARHPEEELLSSDVALKFEIPPEQVRSRLDRAVREAMLVRQGGKQGRGNESTYCAGPVLLGLIGFRRVHVAGACVPAAE